MSERRTRASKPARASTTAPSDDYRHLVGNISALLETARHASARAINALMTATYWEIGRYIVEFEQHGSERAEYGEALLTRLSHDLTSRYGRGFAKSNLYQMRSFYLAYQDILQTLSGKFAGHSAPAATALLRTASGQSPALSWLGSIAAYFPLPWSAYVRLLAVKNEQARRFYETEALRGGWSVRQLDRQINAQFYERTALSKNRDYQDLSRCSI
jgi:hypothetical protein